MRLSRVSFPMRYVNLYVIMKPLQLVRIEQTRTNCIRYRNIKYKYINNV